MKHHEYTFRVEYQIVILADSPDEASDLLAVEHPCPDKIDCVDIQEMPVEKVD